MRYQQDLQVGVRERLRRLMAAHYSTAGHEVRLTVDWIIRQPALRAVIAEAECAEPGLDVEAFASYLQSIHGFFRWPSQTEEGRAVLAWGLMQRIAAEDQDGTSGDRITIGYAHEFGDGGDFNDAWRGFAERILQPLFDYLTERIGAEGSVRYVLERYVRRVEWFDRNGLYTRYNRQQREGGVGEEVYNLDLQRFLFVDGNYVTHAKPRSASGEADLVGGLDTEDPLVCEGKIFDGSRRGKHYLANGVHQVAKYAEDHNKNVAYLVVFNITDRLVQFPTDGVPGVWPPYVEVSGIRVYLVGVRAFPPATTASKSGKANPVEIARGDLFVNVDATP